MKAPALALLFATAAVGCTQTFYYARRANLDGQGHEALASWSVTERSLWFDENSETVRVTLQCGKTTAFQEREGGLFVLFDPTRWVGPRTIGGEAYCGRVEGVATLADIDAGDSLTLELWCAPAEDDEGFGIAAPDLPAGRHRFEGVERSEVARAVKPCELPQ